MSFYSPDIVDFDVVPPLQVVGAATLRDRFTEWFAGFEGQIGMDLRDLHIFAGGDLAVAHWLSRSSGTLTNGRSVGSRVRATSCGQRSHDGWLITHEQISLPVDVAADRPAADLVP